MNGQNAPSPARRATPLGKTVGVQNLQRQALELEETYHLAPDRFHGIDLPSRHSQFTVSEACRQISDRSGSDRSTANKLAKWRKLHYPSYLTIK